MSVKFPEEMIDMFVAWDSKAKALQCDYGERVTASKFGIEVSSQSDYILMPTSHWATVVDRDEIWSTPVRRLINMARVYIYDHKYDTDLGVREGILSNKPRDSTQDGNGSPS